MLTGASNDKTTKTVIIETSSSKIYGSCEYEFLGAIMRCQECEKLEFIISELTKQLEEERSENRRLREIIREKGE